MVVAVALSSCTSAKTTEEEQFSITRTESVQLDETIQKVFDGYFYKSQQSLNDAIVEEPVNEPETKPETVPNTTQEIMPIIRNYSIDGQDLSITAYPGRAYLAFPKSWSLEKLNRIASYLAQKHPEETKDIIYKVEDGIIFLFYPESWGENELSYAELLLVQEIATLTEMENSYEEEAVTSIAEEVYTEPGYETITEESYTETKEPIVATSSSEASVDNWWEDPIFMKPNTEEPAIENEEAVYEFTEEIEHNSENSIEEQSDNVPFVVDPEIIEKPVANQEASSSSLHAQIKHLIVIVVILAVLYIFVLVLIKRKTNKKKDEQNNNLQ